jgi:hypothetical protein
MKLAYLQMILNTFFSKMTQQRGVFCSITDLQDLSMLIFAEHSAGPKLFVWIKSADAILAKLDRLPAPPI